MLPNFCLSTGWESTPIFRAGPDVLAYSWVKHLLLVTQAQLNHKTGTVMIITPCTEDTQWELRGWGHYGQRPLAMPFVGHGGENGNILRRLCSVMLILTVASEGGVAGMLKTMACLDELSHPKRWTFPWDSGPPDQFLNSSLWPRISPMEEIRACWWQLAVLTRFWFRIWIEDWRLPFYDVMKA